ncbi:MAG: SpoIIE family protein phosphatase, partial [Candidatus Eremiobacterota bacterium]
QARMARHAVEKKRAHSYYLDKDAGEGEFDPALIRAGFAGVLSVPLIARKKMVGVLNCFAPQGMRFRQQEIRLVRGFANQAAIAVENARLHGLVRFKMGELGTLFEVSKAVTSTLQLDRVLQEIVHHVREILRADACSLMLLEGDRLILKTAEGIELGPQREPIRVGQGALGLAVQTGRPVVLIDREGAGEEEFPAGARSEGLATILSVPVETRGRAIGLINVYYREYTTPTPAQINLLAALGSQAAVAIENARLYAEKERVAELLRDVLIPRERLEFPGVAVGHRFLPSMDLSGDYYDLIPLGKSRCGLVIADVSGKGPDAAIQTVRAKHILKSYALAGYSPRKVLSLLNHQVGQDPVAGRQVTVFYAEADLKTRRLRFASAGHEPPIFWSPHQERPRLLYADGILIGAVPDAEYEDCSVELPEGSWLILYTDGLSEARSPSGDFFGLQRVLDLVSGHTGNSPQRLVNRIYDEVRRFTGGRFSDDFSVMAIRF